MKTFKAWVSLRENVQYQGDIWSSDSAPDEQYRIGDWKRPTPDTLEGIARQFTKVQSVPLTRLLDSRGRLSGDSDEPEDSPAFAARTAGLDAKDFQPGGNSPPILVVKSNNRLEVADGRHRTINYVRMLRDAQQDWRQATIQGFIIDKDNPAVNKAMQVARVE